MAFGDVCYGGKADIACFSCTPVSADKPWRTAGQLRQLFGSLSKVQRRDEHSLNFSQYPLY